MEFVAWLILYFAWTNWLSWIPAVILLTTAQIQAGWAQHDFGHLSVFKDRKMDTLVHHFTIGVLKGASSSWWKTRHNRHHAKTNILHKDPDIHNYPLFLFGENMAKLQLGWGATQFQHYYWWFAGPPVVTTLLFPFQVIRHIIRKRAWDDGLSVTLFFVRWGVMFVPLMGYWNTGLLYVFVRFLESHWFTWVTSMNHLPMEIDEEKNHDWVTLHLVSTQNVEHTWFNDWFSGHLNFQIEHHLFPTMPRHNYAKVQPRVKALCDKYGIKMRVMSLWVAFANIYQALSKAAHIRQPFFPRHGFLNF